MFFRHAKSQPKSQAFNSNIWNFQVLDLEVFLRQAMTGQDR